MKKTMKRIFYCLTVGLFLLGCKTESSSDIDTAALHLPDIHLFYPEYEALDSTKAYSNLAYKLVQENRDLQSPQMYVEAALLYDKTENRDSILQLLNLSINRGMANPKILQKFTCLKAMPQNAAWTNLSKRLDSIQEQLKKIDHFSIEMGAMNEFWDYFERAKKDTSKAKDVLKEFIFNGPYEVRDFYFVRYENPTTMYGQMINGTPAYYEHLREHLNADSLLILNQKITGWMKNLQEIYPEAVFPKVYVVPGILNSGGTVTEMGMYVGGDMYGRSDDMPTEGLSDWQKGAIMQFSDLPGIIIHELMHFQQSYQDTANSETVLMGVIGEGVCDFFVELVSGIEMQNSNLEYLKDPENMEFVLSELKAELFIDDNSKWLYNGGSIKDRPHDLGYTMGYLISKSYYNNHTDKATAVYELLNTSDVVSILEGSDYAFLLTSEEVSSDLSK